MAERPEGTFDVVDELIPLRIGPHRIERGGTGANAYAGVALVLTAPGGAVVTVATESATTVEIDTCESRWCGDGVAQPELGERCDDGNDDFGDGCSPACRVERCGDGITHRGLGEACDDLTPDRGCDADCGRVWCRPHTVLIETGLVPDAIGWRIVDALGAVVHEAPVGTYARPVTPYETPVELEGGHFTFEILNGRRWVAGRYSVLAPSGATLRSAAPNPQSDTYDFGDFTAICDVDRCGDGTVEAGLGEECEDEPGCADDCTFYRCGDLRVSPDDGEACDDGDARPGDGCDADCQLESCAAHTVHITTTANPHELAWRVVNAAGEVIDSVPEGTYARAFEDFSQPISLPEGDFTLVMTHRGAVGGSTVRIRDRLGHETVRLNTNAYDERKAFHTTCIWGDCGDGIVQPRIGEVCDDGNTDADDGCDAFCQAESCGDGVVQAGLGEMCDDGDAGLENRAGDGCNEICITEICGNGVEQPELGEACDDGGVEPGDGCGPTCQPERCGDGHLRPGEACDDANDASGDGCDADCQVERCGDGVVQPGLGEACDGGEDCDADCRAIVCGDGIVHAEAGEECDDGLTDPGLTPGDGCSERCLV